MKECPNCKTLNTGESNYCAECGAKIANGIIKEVISNNSEDENKANYLAIIGFVLYYIAPVVIPKLLMGMPKSIINASSSFVGLCPLAAIVIMIIGRNKYPQNKLLKALMWCIIFTITISLLTFIIFFMWCMASCK